MFKFVTVFFFCLLMYFSIFEIFSKLKYSNEFVFKANRPSLYLAMHGNVLTVKFLFFLQILVYYLCFSEIRIKRYEFLKICHFLQLF